MKNVDENGYYQCEECGEYDMSVQYSDDKYLCEDCYKAIEKYIDYPRHSK